MLADPNEGAARRSLNVMIDLYKKRFWNDEKTVNVIAQACLNDNPKICASASKFFLMQSYDAEDDSGSDSDDEDKNNLLRHHIGSKLTKGKEAKLARAIKTHKRKEKRRNKT